MTLVSRGEVLHDGLLLARKLGVINLHIELDGRIVIHLMNLCKLTETLLEPHEETSSGGLFSIYNVELINV